MLHAECVDRGHLFALDDEVLTDLPILIAAFHDGAREDEHRDGALVLDDERVDASTARHLAHLRGLLRERVVERDERTDVDLRARRDRKDREVAERGRRADRVIVRVRGSVGRT